MPTQSASVFTTWVEEATGERRKVRVKNIQHSAWIQWGIEPSWIISLPICAFLPQSLLVSLCLGFHLRKMSNWDYSLCYQKKKMKSRLQNNKTKQKNRKPHKGKYKQIVIKREMWLALVLRHSTRSQEVINPCQKQVDENYKHICLTACFWVCACVCGRVRASGGKLVGVGWG